MAWTSWPSDRREDRPSDAVEYRAASRAWAAYNRGDEEAFAACLTDDWREYGPDGGSATLEDERATMELHRLAFPDKQPSSTASWLMRTRSRVTCTVTATHTGKYLDAEPTGKRVVVHEMMFNSVRAGRVAVTWAMTAGPGLLRADHRTRGTKPSTISGDIAELCDSTAV